MSWIKRLLYGLLLGITSIAPGISGGTIAIALGFYENLISAVANILKEFRKNFSFLLPFAVGVAISMATLSVALEQLFIKAPLPTNALFIGLILGTFPFIKGKFSNSLNGHKATAKHFITGAAFFIIVLIPVFAGEGSNLLNLTWDSDGGAGTILTFTFIGIIMAATLIIPGLSGTMILMSMGLYMHLLHIASSSVTAAAGFDIRALISLMPQLIPLGAGMIIGGILLAKILNAMFERIPSYIYAAITGLLIATPIVMLSQVGASNVTALNVIISILTFAAGLILVKKLGSE